MQTVNEGLNKAYKEAGQNAYFGNGFMRGIDFAQRWIPVEDELPMCYETGKWDGFRSNFCLVKLKDSSVEVARVYRGRKNGFDFCRWRDKLEYEFKDAIITHWRPIEYPLL